MKLLRREEPLAFQVCPMFLPMADNLFVNRASPDGDADLRSGGEIRNRNVKHK